MFPEKMIRHKKANLVPGEKTINVMLSLPESAADKICFLAMKASVAEGRTVSSQEIIRRIITAESPNHIQALIDSNLLESKILQAIYLMLSDAGFKPTKIKRVSE